MFTRKEDETPSTSNYSPSAAPTGSASGAVRSTVGSPSGANVISRGTFIQGDVFCEGDLKVDGEVTGKIYSKSKVTVGKGGFVDGNIECVQAEIYGRVQGALTVQDHLFLRSEAKMDGDVLTAHLEMEPTVKFNGKCTMQDKVTLSDNVRNGGRKAAAPAGSSATTAAQATSKPSSTPATASANGNSDLKKNGEKERSSAGIFQK